MNKLLIGLLIVAVGAGAFLLLRKKNNSTATNDIKKEWIVGKWVTEATQPGDSNFSTYNYDFRENGNIIQSLNDSASADTMHYEWSRNNELVWKERATDSTGNIFTVLRLTPDSLQLQSKDSTSILFTKLK